MQIGDRCVHGVREVQAEYTITLADHLGRRRGLSWGWCRRSWSADQVARAEVARHVADLVQHGPAWMVQVELPNPALVLLQPGLHDAATNHASFKSELCCCGRRFGEFGAALSTRFAEDLDP